MNNLRRTALKGFALALTLPKQLLACSLGPYYPHKVYLPNSYRQYQGDFEQYLKHHYKDAIAMPSQVKIIAPDRPDSRPSSGLMAVVSKLPKGYYCSEIAVVFNVRSFLCYEIAHFRLSKSVLPKIGMRYRPFENPSKLYAIAKFSNLADPSVEFYAYSEAKLQYNHSCAGFEIIFVEQKFQ